MTTPLFGLVKTNICIHNYSMQSSIVILGLGKIGASFTSNFITDVVVGRYTFCNERVELAVSDGSSDQALPELIANTFEDISNAIANYKVAIIISALSDTIDSILIPDLVDKLIGEGKTCFALVTIPLRLEEIEKRRCAKAISKRLGKIMPPRHLSILDTQKFGDKIQGLTEDIYATIAVSFFESETNYILKHGVLYRILNFPEDENPSEGSRGLKLGLATVEELLQRLNELWGKRIKRSIHFDADREESENILIEIKERGYVLIGEEQYAMVLAPHENLDSLLKKIRADKAKVVNEKRYEEAARLRDQEKRLMREMLLVCFAKIPDDYFLLWNATSKTVVYRLSNVNLMDAFVRRISKMP